ncbi:MAG: energy transducer TonB [Oleiagrimonas sp.]|jgi:protein TonB|nr:energy transducer TonB [Oleiagrimonas sp.]
MFRSLAAILFLLWVPSMLPTSAMPDTQGKASPPPPMMPGHQILRELRLVHYVPPIHPLHARQHHVEGTIMLKLEINTQGKVVEIEPPRGDAPDELVQAAITAARQWRFEPAINRLHEKTGCWAQIPVAFQL